MACKIACCVDGGTFCAGFEDFSCKYDGDFRVVPRGMRGSTSQVVHECGDADKSCRPFLLCYG